MERMDALPKSPKHITDLVVLANALHTLETLEKEHGREYVFEYIQQPMIGGTCHPVPVGLPSSENGSRVIATFDKKYFIDRLNESRNQEKYMQ